jgi:hypothetical protein
MNRRATRKGFVICVGNEGFEASLVVRRVYERIDDRVAQGHGLVRVKDESGEDYLFPAKLFVPIAIPRGAGRAFLRAS